MAVFGGWVMEESPPPECRAQRQLLIALGCFFAWRQKVLRKDAAKPDEITQHAIELLEELTKLTNKTTTK